MLRTLVGLLIFVADVWAILQIIQSKATPLAKVLWCLLVLILPIVGLIIWYIAGPKK